MSRPTKSILYQSPDRSVTLLDIPTSIALAQETHDQSNEYTLLSSQPQEEPYTTNEPKSDKAKQKVQENTVNARLHDEYRTLIEEALAEIKEHRRGGWCLPRKFSLEAVTRREKKRKTESLLQTNGQANVNPANDQCITSFDLHQELAIVETSVDIDSDIEANRPKNVQPNLSKRNPNINTKGQWDGVYQNTDPHLIHLTLASRHEPNDTATFKIPSHSTFILGKCDNPSNPPSFVNQTLKPPSLQPNLQPSKFPLILLDPPWPNRSARRSSSYTTSPTLHSTRTLLTSLNLPHHLQPRGYLAIWTTNKPSFRHLLLSPTHGLFAEWNLHLVEEWIWVKVTTNGDPITPLDSLWRKPYEVLLIGRAAADGPSHQGTLESEQGPQRTKRRIIAAVPDLHSRKPCLKELFREILETTEVGEEAVKGGQPQSVLELFARHLVAGWCSWGDEVLKFNQDIYWSLD